MSVPAESIFFDLWSATYDRPGLQRTTYRPIHDAVLNRLDGLKPDHVLDLGCGTGQLTERLGAAFPDALVVGADLSDGMLERATDRMANEHAAAFLRADAQHLPIADGSLDIVTCTESFHWYADQTAAAAEHAMRRSCCSCSSARLATPCERASPLNRSLPVETACPKPRRLIPRSTAPPLMILTLAAWSEPPLY